MSASTVKTIACRIYSVIFALLFLFFVGCGLLAFYWSATGLPPQIAKELPRDVGALSIHTFTAALGGGFIMVGALHGWLTIYAWKRRVWPLVVGTVLWVLLTIPSLTQGSIALKLIFPGVLALLTVVAIAARANAPLGETSPLTRPIFALQRQTIPRNARHFEKLVYAIIVALIAGAPLQHQFASRHLTPQQAQFAANPVFSIVITIISAALVWLLMWFVVYRRRNWARWVFLAWFLISLPMAAVGYKMFPDFDVLALGLSALNLCLWALALYFIFTGDAKDWFARSQPAAVAAATPRQAFRAPGRVEPLLWVVLVAAIFASTFLVVFLFSR